MSKSKDNMTIYDNKNWSGKKFRHGCTDLCKQHVRAANGNYKLHFTYPNFCWHETKRNSDSHNHQIVKLQENQHESAFTNLQSKHVTLACRSPVAALHLAVWPPKMDCWKSWLAIRQVDPEGQLPCLRVPIVTTRIDQGSWYSSSLSPSSIDLQWCSSPLSFQDFFLKFFDFHAFLPPQ